jgi:hypothetical protein
MLSLVSNSKDVVTVLLIACVYPTGKLVGEFNGYFIQGSHITKEEFLATVNNNA